MTPRNIILMLAGSAAAAALYAADIHIAKGTGAVEWPPAGYEAMTTMPDGNFHVALTSLEAGDGFVFADRANPSEPVRIGPKGNKEIGSRGNWVYQIGDGDAVQATPGTALSGSGAVSPISDFDLWTDKARYSPGETVWISASKFADYAGATVRYRHGTVALREEPLKQEWWPWTPPADDFRGYMVDVYRLDADGAEEILGSIGVDVSSDWKRFPRYGYTAWYERGKEEWVPGDVAFLNRRHINAVQFQDWHWKHHRPYCADDYYTDISNREVSHNVVKMFIDTQHGYNMKSIFYNLGFGALERDGAAADGVKDEWYYFLDEGRTRKDSHPLPTDWKSDISLVDPGNTEWQRYLCDRNEEVYSNLGFDGFQVDQLGSRGDGGWVYDYRGNRINLASRYPLLLKALKERHPSKTLIMNSVSRFAEREIASSGVIDVCYNEMWGDCADMADLYKVIASNRQSGGEGMKTVFANYMNYDYAVKNNGKNFNAPGVLLTDACIFALGGAHLELGTGYNMLCNEYFPNTNLRMDDSLVEAITRYYDFITAYENYIYDASRELEPTVTSRSGHPMRVWTAHNGPAPRKVMMVARETESGASVYHLLNFRNVNSMSWRDVNGDMPKPERQTDIVLDIDTDRMVSKVWAATPDSHAGVPQPLAFTQEGRTVRVTVPSLDYWTMLVFE